ncbi:uncharacterized protein TNCV_2787881 [Trichonephila clavipes]|uniref:Uncharacterized protein n=1 Tax=Trichonephila clavipes TaxID=2585209 RepID=A0A8X6SS58_TRICX|nr:uncharacterized protein TNCV_2787881 [Trichonephila clavipes]
MKPEENLKYFDLVMGHILVHDAHSLCNPMNEGIALEAGSTYDLFVNKRVTTRLPAPYNTNCTDYLKLWRQNGGQGPLTERYRLTMSSVGYSSSLKEGRFVLGTFLSKRNASTLPITPKRSSSRDVGTISYRYHTATYSSASVSANRRTNDTIFVANM